MNSEYQRELRSVAGERAREHPADMQSALMRGMDRYRRRIRLTYAAALGVALLAVGLLFMGHQMTTAPKLITINLVASVEIQPTAIAELSAEGIYSDGTRKDLGSPPLEWTSDNLRVAKVDAGKVTGLAPGKANVTASLNGVATTVQVLVNKAKLEEIIVKGPKTLTQDEAYTFLATGKFSDGKESKLSSITWKSNNEAVAKVNSATGRVTGSKPGNAIITATAKGLKKSGKAKVEVTTMPTETPSTATTPNAPPTPTATTPSVRKPGQTLVNIVVDGPPQVAQDETRLFTATGYNSEGEEVPLNGIEWRSDSSDVANVDPAGNVRGMSPGHATITAVSGGRSGSKPVEVLPGTCQASEVVEALYLGREFSVVERDLNDLGVQVEPLPQAYDDVPVNQVTGVSAECRSGQVVATVTYSTGPVAPDLDPGTPTETPTSP